MKKTTVWNQLHKQVFCLLFFSGQFCFSLLTHASTIIHDSSLYKHERSSAILESKSGQDKKGYSGSDRRVLKKELKYQIKKYSRHKVANDKEKSDATFQIIMIILLALGLFLLLAIISFVIAYSGLEGLGIGILIGGLAGIIFLTISLIKKVNKRKREQSSLAVNVN
jgi:hypothetical protein